MIDAVDVPGFNGAELVELLGVDYRGACIQRHSAAGVAGAAAARDDGQIQVDAGLYDRGYFGLVVR